MKPPRRVGVASGGGAVVVAAVLASFTPAAPSLAQVTEADLWEFVSSFDGMPYARALEFRRLEGAPDLLRRWLTDPGRVAAWTNAVAVLGILGDESDIDLLKKLILNGADGVSRDLLRERAAALQALAFLAHEADKVGRTSKALEALLTFTEAGYLESQGVVWPGVENLEQRKLLTRELDRQALLMLSLTGEESAKARIEARRNELDDESFVGTLLATYEAVTAARERGEGLSELY